MSKINENYETITAAGYLLFQSDYSYSSKTVEIWAWTGGLNSESTDSWNIRDVQFFNDYMKVMDSSLVQKYQGYYLRSLLKFSKVGSAADTAMYGMIGQIPKLAATREARQQALEISAAIPAAPSSEAPRKTSKRL